MRLPDDRRVPPSSPGLLVASAVSVAVFALVARLLSVLRVGGLFGYGNYDDAVYFAAAMGLVHGRLPYRDFVFLQPPGIVLSLAPFAATSYPLTDGQAFAAARVGWMVLGAVTAVLVLMLLWPIHRFGAVVAGLVYALFWPAVYGEHTTLLEAPANVLLALALLILTRAPDERGSAGRRWWLWWLLPGVLLGMSCSIKIWDVVPAVAVAGWVLITRRLRPFLAVLVGGALGGVVTMGPFFAAAPADMWRNVVDDQVTRLPVTSALQTRLSGVVGHWGYTRAPMDVLVGLVALWVVLVLLALLNRRTWFFAVLHLGLAAVLVVSPSWYPHYAALVAPTAALVAGSAVANVAARLGPEGRLRTPHAARVVLAAIVVVLVVLSAAPVLERNFNKPFPRAQLLEAVRGVDGCVATDDPTNLIELDRQGHDLTRGCQLVVDLSGSAFEQRVDGEQVLRNRNPGWQRFALSYFRSADRVVISRLTDKKRTRFGGRVDQAVASWPLVTRVGRVTVRVPQP